MMDCLSYFVFRGDKMRYVSPYPMAIRPMEWSRFCVEMIKLLRDNGRVNPKQFFALAKEAGFMKSKRGSRHVGIKLGSLQGIEKVDNDNHDSAVWASGDKHDFLFMRCNKNLNEEAVLEFAAALGLKERVLNSLSQAPQEVKVNNVDNVNKVNTVNKADKVDIRVTSYVKDDIAVWAMIGTPDIKRMGFLKKARVERMNALALLEAVKFAATLNAEVVIQTTAKQGSMDRNVWKEINSIVDENPIEIKDIVPGALSMLEYLAKREIIGEPIGEPLDLFKAKPAEPKPEPKQDKLIVYTDGSCLSNPGPGGWAVIGPDFELSGNHPETTNNRMEMTAIIEAVKYFQDSDFHKMEIVSDSQYSIDTFSKWMYAWEKRGWKKSNGEIKNLDIIKEAFDLLKDNRDKVTFKKVKGHAGHPLNERADEVAKAEATSLLFV